jgi:uncharacterized protein (TIGR02270 family)
MWDVVEEHVSEAGIAWAQWSRAMVAPNYHLREVAEGPEALLVANLDGLAEAGDEVVDRLLLPALEGEEPDRVVPAALAILATRSGLSKIGTTVPRALELTATSIDEELENLLAKAEPSLQAVLLRVLAFRGWPVALRSYLSNADPHVQAAAVRAARLHGGSLRPFVEASLDSPAPEVREEAMRVAASFGSAVAWNTARAETSEFGLSLLGISGDAKDVDRLEAALANEKRRGAALFALGFTGLRRAVELCLLHLEDPKYARLAGEAIAAITGLAIDAREEEKKEEPIPFEEEDLDASLIPGPEAMLVLPDADAVRAMWKRESSRFRAEVRYLGGKPFDLNALNEALLRGPMRRRPLLALERAAKGQGKPWIETGRWARDQLKVS